MMYNELVIHEDHEPTLKKSVKWLEIPIQKFNTVVPHFVDLLKDYENNIIKVSICFVRNINHSIITDYVKRHPHNFFDYYISSVLLNLRLSKVSLGVIQLTTKIVLDPSMCPCKGTLEGV